MGLADRDYQRDSPTGGGSFLPGLTPVVKWLLILNIGIFILDYLLLPLALGIRIDDFHAPPLIRWGAFCIQTSIIELRIWEFISFQFLHGNLAHILFNSLGIYFFGPWMERWWGSKKFLIFYLLCGIGGAAFFSILTVLHLIPGGDESYLVGASAGIYGILVGIAFIAPDLRARLLFPPIELSMRQLAIGLIGISVIIILLSIGNNAGGEAGHLGGAIAGFLLMKFPRLLGRGEDEVNIIRPRAFSRRSQAKLRPRTDAHLDEANEVDRILDKISREGTQSLSQGERDLLMKASERHRKP
jgi:membrane associated rhomboid family serine protease